jgi:Kef-type K+ transport system membrane component KefB
MSSATEFISAFPDLLKEPQVLFLLQLLIIITIAKLTGFLLSKAGQPAVVGEIAAGILLGPSLLGAVLPEFSAVLFPAESLTGLHYLSQIGLILFMFIVGLELDLNDLKGEAKTIALISFFSIAVPFGCGVFTGYKLFHLFTPEHHTMTSFALFMGISFSITAFPVLARIILERNMQRTKVGYLSLSSAAINDCAAWFLLSAILAYIQTENLYAALIRFVCILAYAGFMFFVVKPIILRQYQKIKQHFTVIMIAVVLFSSILTELLGIHALFGAFTAGIIISDKAFNKTELIKKIHDISVILFLPVFFALSGLRTSIGLINSSSLWMLFFVILLVAIASKLISSALAAKFSGLNWQDAVSIGILMNTRGLIELIILNIGYDLGIIQPALFTILVLMALITTFMTGPLLNMVQLLKSVRKSNP